MYACMHAINIPASLEIINYVIRYPTTLPFFLSFYHLYHFHNKYI